MRDFLRNHTDQGKAIALLLCVWAVAYGMIFFQQGIPAYFINLLIQSPHPKLALIAGSGFLSNFIIILVRFADIGLGFLGKTLGSEKLRVYLVALPLWLNMLLTVLFAIVLFFIVPYCDTPNAMRFVVEDTTYSPGATVLAQPGQTLVIKAQTVEQDVKVSCKWELAGDAFQGLDRKNGCTTTAKLSRQAGQGILTLIVNRSFCSKKAFFPLIIQIEAP